MSATPSVNNKKLQNTLFFKVEFQKKKKSDWLVGAWWQDNLFWDKQYVETGKGQMFLDMSINFWFSSSKKLYTFSEEEKLLRK